MGLLFRWRRWCAHSVQHRNTMTLSQQFYQHHKQRNFFELWLHQMKMQQHYKLMSFDAYNYWMDRVLSIALLLLRTSAFTENVQLPLPVMISLTTSNNASNIAYGNSGGTDATVVRVTPTAVMLDHWLLNIRHNKHRNQESRFHHVGDVSESTTTVDDDDSSQYGDSVITAPEESDTENEAEANVDIVNMF